MRITLPHYVNDFLHEIMEEMGFNKSDLLEQMVLYVSMPENMEDFKSQFELGGAGEEEDDDEPDTSSDEEDKNYGSEGVVDEDVHDVDDDEEEDEDDEPGFWERLFGRADEDEE